jgi:hypothetical protein
LSKCNQCTAQKKNKICGGFFQGIGLKMFITPCNIRKKRRQFTTCIWSYLKIFYQ